ncbi:MAG: flagellar hook-associated protein FlgK [Thiobacillaceae bacterium]
MSSSILSIGSSALAVAQAGLSTTSHNISNASTPGFSRQEIIQASSQAQATGAGYMGQGVQVTTVRRIYNDFLTRQLTDVQSSSSQLDSYQSNISKLNNLLADPASGLSPAMQDFFSGVNAVANNPANTASRQAMLSNAQSLVSRLQSMQNSFDAVRQGVESQMSASVDSINSYATQIAQINDAISKSELSNNGQTANDLRDQRDLLISDLNKEIKATVVRQDDGAYNVFVGNGQSLVIGNQASSLVTLRDPSDGNRLQIGFRLSGVTMRLNDSSISGGTLGGLLSFRTASMDAAQNTLGQIALGLAGSFNAQHHLGVDQNGIPGGDFFKIVQPTAIANSANGGSATLAVNISDYSALTTSDYQVAYDGSNYSITRLSDQTVQTASSLPASMDGIDFGLGSGSLAAGDTFLIRPTLNGAGSIGVAISDTRKIAAAAPISTNAPGSNLGSGKISAGSVDASYLGTPLSTPINLAYNLGSNTLSGFPLASVTVNSGGTLTTYAPGAPVAFVADASYSVNGMSFSLSGNPANGDQFSIAPNTSGTGDNRNALLLAGLQTQNVLGGGTTSFQTGYAQLTSQVGNKAREIQTSSLAQNKLLEQANAAVQGMSGVNLDEEAANLLRYQQAYQAAGKVMQIAGTLFDTLLSLGR